MNLIYNLAIMFFNFRSLKCLKINELKNDKILIPFSPLELVQADFLDVDILSDVLPTTVTIYDAANQKSHAQNFSFYSKDKKPYKCWIDAEPDKAETSGQYDEILKQIILNRKKSCYYFKGKNWIYEYCHLKSTRQVSRNKINDNHEEFSLGRFYPPRRSLTFQSSLNRLSTEFFDGSYCSISGFSRTSRIRFICANDKQGMYLTNVIETSACMYDFLIHVPELCDHLPKHATIPKQSSKIKCVDYASKRVKLENERTSSSKSNENPDELDKILGIIESTYKDSSVLSQYKNLLLKATEKLKSQQLAKDFSQRDSNVPFLDLFNKLTKSDSDPINQEESEESEQKQQ